MVYSTYSYEEHPVYHSVLVIKDEQRSWKRIMVVDDDEDITSAFRLGIEDSNSDTNRKIEVYTSNDPVVALSEFRPNFYDLVLVDINMPHTNGFEFCGKMLAIDINVRVCYMSSVEINREALRQIYPSLSLGYFIRKPVTVDYLIKRQNWTKFDSMMEKACRKYLSLHAFL